MRMNHGRQGLNRPKVSEQDRPKGDRSQNITPSDIAATRKQSGPVRSLSEAERSALLLEVLSRRRG
jgi:hypothetical protein